MHERNPTPQGSPTPKPAEAMAGDITAGRVRRPEYPGGPMRLGEAMNVILNKSGYLTPERAAQLDQAAARRAAQDLELKASRLRSGCEVPVRYQAADLEDVEYARRRLAPGEFDRYLGVRDELATLLRGPGLVVLRGGPGPGKTHLACALVHAFCDRGRPAFFTTAFDYLTAILATPASGLQALSGRFRAYDLLVIDEIEVRSDSQWANNNVRATINGRYNAMVSTVVITNKEPEELPEYFGPAICDRLRQDGAVVACDWSSLRTPEP